MANQPSHSQAFDECLRGLLELHRLTALGRPDSAEADEVRDRTDVPWQSLTSEEKDRLGGLSEGLYSLGAGLVYGKNDDETVELTARAFGMSEVDVRFMLAVGRGESRGDIIEVGDGPSGGLPLLAGRRDRPRLP